MRKMTSRQITRCAGLVRALEEVRVTRTQFESGIRRLPDADKAYYQRLANGIEAVTHYRGQHVNAILYCDAEQQAVAREALVFAKRAVEAIRAERLGVRPVVDLHASRTEIIRQGSVPPAEPSDWERHLSLFLEKAGVDEDTPGAVDYYEDQWHKAELWDEDMPDPIECARDYLRGELAWR